MPRETMVDAVHSAPASSPVSQVPQGWTISPPGDMDEISGNPRIAFANFEEIKFSMSRGSVSSVINFFVPDRLFHESLIGRAIEFAFFGLAKHERTYPAITAERIGTKRGVRFTVFYREF